MKEEERPDAIIIGSPPAFRGSTVRGRDIEMEVMRLFPNKIPAVGFFQCFPSRRLE